MDTNYLVGIALFVAVVIFFFLRKSSSERATSAPAEKLKPKSELDVTPRPVDQDEVSKPEPQPVAAPAEQPLPVVDEAAADAEFPTERDERKRDIPGMRQGLARARSGEGFFGRLKAMLSGRAKIDDAIAEEMEEILLTSDVGSTTTSAILERLRGQLTSGTLKDEQAVWDALSKEAVRVLSIEGTPHGLDLRHSPTVVLLVGVNGAGKTTTIGKLATQLQAQGKTCVLAAGDTFRAAAVQQLVVWGQRIGCEVIRGKDGADPGSVVFDAVKRAKEIGADVVLADTAGRLHTKSNLMAEMKKIERTLAKAAEGAPHETLLVIDATTGQNAMAQAKEFKDTLDLTGIVLTKLDGTAKGGFVLGISDTLQLPVRFVGLGERPNDLHEFDASDFVEALLGRDA